MSRPDFPRPYTPLTSGMISRIIENQSEYDKDPKRWERREREREEERLLEQEQEEQQFRLEQEKLELRLEAEEDRRQELTERGDD